MLLLMVTMSEYSNRNGVAHFSGGVPWADYVADPGGWFRKTAAGRWWLTTGARWVEPRDEGFGAALSCTDAGDLVPEQVTMPAPIVAFTLKGLGAPTFAVAQIVRWGSEDHLARVKSNPFKQAIIRGGDRKPVAVLRVVSGDRVFIVSADTMWEALLAEAAPRVGEAPTPDGDWMVPPDAYGVRVLEAVRRQVVGLLLAMPVRSNWTYVGVRLAQAKKVRGLPASTQLYVLGKPVRCDVTEGLRRYLGGEGKSPTVRFMVRGHYRNQACGPAQTQRKIIWIQPHWKGDDGAPILARPHAVGPT